MMSEVWAKWENRVINGVLPLRRFLGRSNHSVVFLTEYKVQNLADAAIKLVPADPASADAQLAYWKSAATLAHPHLIRLFETGRCQLGGHPFLFAVMEYAEETLAQILPKRPLTADEVRELLRPTLAALRFLHDKDLVHGQLKPANFLVIGDQLKLSSDNIHPVGKSRPSIAKRSVYDPPEAKIGGIDAKGDVWGLGVTMVEALTQRLPAGLDQRTEIAVLPPAPIPPGFEEVTERCLNRDPALRPTIDELTAQFVDPPPAEAAQSAASAETGAADAGAAAPAPGTLGAPSSPGAPVTPAAPAARPEMSLTELLVQAPNLGSPAPAPGRRLALWGAVAGVLIAASVWVVWHYQHPSLPSLSAQAPSPQAAASADASAAPPAAPQNPAPAPPAAAAPAPAADDSRSVRHEEIPRISRGARASIRGDIVVTVRVTVDRSGNVVDEAVENRGNSKYFTRVASEAARKWRFVAADRPDPREWLLQFEFTRGGTSGHAIPRS